MTNKLDDMLKNFQQELEDFNVSMESLDTMKEEIGVNEDELTTAITDAVERVIRRTDVVSGLSDFSNDFDSIRSDFSCLISSFETLLEYVKRLNVLENKSEADAAKILALQNENNELRAIVHTFYDAYESMNVAKMKASEFIIKDAALVAEASKSAEAGSECGA